MIRPKRSRYPAFGARGRLFFLLVFAANHRVLCSAVVSVFRVGLSRYFRCPGRTRKCSAPSKVARDAQQIQRDARTYFPTVFRHCAISIGPRSKRVREKVFAPFVVVSRPHPLRRRRAATELEIRRKRFPNGRRVVTAGVICLKVKSRFQPAPRVLRAGGTHSRGGRTRTRE